METIKMYFGEVLKYCDTYPYFWGFLFFAIMTFALTHYYFKEKNRSFDLKMQLKASKALACEVIQALSDAFNDFVEIKKTLEEVRNNSKDKNLVISKQKKRILELELACLFVESNGKDKDIGKNLTMFRKMTIKELENKKNSWSGSKIIKTKKTGKKTSK